MGLFGCRRCDFCGLGSFARERSRAKVPNATKVIKGPPVEKCKITAALENGRQAERAGLDADYVDEVRLDLLAVADDVDR